jgi:hypothetical protein
MNDGKLISQRIINTILTLLCNARNRRAHRQQFFQLTICPLPADAPRPLSIGREMSRPSPDFSRRRLLRFAFYLLKSDGD